MILSLSQHGEATPAVLCSVLGSSVQERDTKKQRLNDRCTGESSKGTATKTINVLEHVQGKAVRAETAYPGEEKAQGDLLMYLNTCRESAKETEPGPVSGAQWQDQGQGAQTEARKVSSEHQEALFCCEGDRALADSAQRGYGVSILRDTQKLSEHDSKQRL